MGHVNNCSIFSKGFINSIGRGDGEACEGLILRFPGIFGVVNSPEESMTTTVGSTVPIMSKKNKK